MECSLKIFILSIIFGVILFIFLIIIHSIFLSSEKGYLLDTLTVLSCIFLSASSWLVFKRQYESHDSLMDSHWFFVSLGFTLWICAEELWAIRDYLLKFALISDIFWFLGYILVIYGVYKETEKVHNFIKTIPEYSLRIRLIKTPPLVVASALVGYSVFVYTIMGFSNYPIYDFVTENIYLIFDAILLYFSLLMMISYYGGRMTVGLDIFSAGLLLFTVSDSFYILVGGYYPWNPLDIFYVVGYTLMGLGLLVYSRRTVIV